MISADLEEDNPDDVSDTEEPEASPTGERGRNDFD